MGDCHARSPPSVHEAQKTEGCKPQRFENTCKTMGCLQFGRKQKIQYKGESVQMFLLFSSDSRVPRKCSVTRPAPPRPAPPRPNPPQPAPTRPAPTRPAPPCPNPPQS